MPIARQTLLLLAAMLPACCPTVQVKPVAPATPAKPKPTLFWTLEPAGASAARLAELDRTLRRCQAGLARYFPGARPAPLRVLAYGDRRDFVRGLVEQLGFSREHAGYFRRSASPRPIRGKMLVPPDQSAVNNCHELVHHTMESLTDQRKLLEAKWLDEGAATFLAAQIIEPDRVRGQLGWYRSRRRYVPFYTMRTEEGWSGLHRVPALRSLAYLQAMSLVQRLVQQHGRDVVRRVVESSRASSVDDAVRQVTGATPEELFNRWLDATRADRGPALFDKNPAKQFLPRAEPAAVGLDPAAVQALVDEAARTRSDTLIVIKDGRLVVERHFFDERGPIETMSVTKSVVSLAVGLLLAEGKISSVDASMATWLPEWKGTDKQRVTLRHVLTHTSGLEHARAAGVMSQHADRTRYARERPLVGQPGRRFSYSNEAAQLLSEVVRVAAGMPLDRYLEKKLLSPLGIREWRWERDRAGNVQAFYGLALAGRDLARIGLLMLDHGRHGGQQLVPQSWVAAATAPGLPAFPQMGYLWWLRHGASVWVQTPARLERLRRSGLAVARRLGGLSGRRFARPEAYWLEAGALLGRSGRAALLRWVREGNDPPIASVPAEPLGFNANGWQGQYLAVYPRWNLVVVRQRRPVTLTEEENKRHGCWSFFKLVERLARDTAPRVKEQGR